MKKTNKKGFTLVELVIVIAVIAILAGVLIGTFASVISRANQSKAVQEIKAAVDEAYVEYVAQYHEAPKSVKFTVIDDKYVSVQFGGSAVANNPFVGYTVLPTEENASLTLEVNSITNQKVYFVWANGTYSVNTTGTPTASESTELVETVSTEAETTAQENPVETTEP